MAGNINKSMRQNYNEYGVGEYYTLVGSSYRNPHFPAVKQCLREWMDRWWTEECTRLKGRTDIRIMDLAAGSGEVTLSVLEWWNIRTASITPLTAMPSSPNDAITLRPPVTRLTVPRLTRSGVVPSMDKESPIPRIIATDPYTVDAYKSRTGFPCLPLSFQDIASGDMPSFRTVVEDSLDVGQPQALNEGVDVNDRHLDMVICSFALHLVESPSQLFALLWELSTKAKWLVVISPHKKPEIKDNWGWGLWDTRNWQPAQNQATAEVLKDKVHLRVFQSLNIDDGTSIN